MLDRTTRRPHVVFEGTEAEKTLEEASVRRQSRNALHVSDSVLCHWIQRRTTETLAHSDCSLLWWLRQVVVLLLSGLVLPSGTICKLIFPSILDYVEHSVFLIQSLFRWSLNAKTKHQSLGLLFLFFNLAESSPSALNPIPSTCWPLVTIMTTASCVWDISWRRHRPIKCELWLFPRQRTGKWHSGISAESSTVVYRCQNPWKHEIWDLPWQRSMYTSLVLMLWASFTSKVRLWTLVLS